MSGSEAALALSELYDHLGAASRRFPKRLRRLSVSSGVSAALKASIILAADVLRPSDVLRFGGIVQYP